MCSGDENSAAPKRTAFSLIEILVVMAIIFLLLALTLSAVQRVRELAWRTSCANNIRQIAMALQSYHDQKGVLPVGLSRAQNNYPYMAWSARLLPYLEQSALWNATEAAFRTTTEFYVDPPHVGLSTSLNTFNCPRESIRFGSARPEVAKAATTNYFGVSSSGKRTNDGVIFLESKIKLTQISDGCSTTLLIGERGMAVDGNGEFRLGWWYGGKGQMFDGVLDYVLSVRQNRSTYLTPTCPLGPYNFGPGRADNPCDLFHFWSLHPGGANFAMCDGSVHFLSYSADKILPALATRAGNEAVELP